MYSLCKKRKYCEKCRLRKESNVFFKQHGNNVYKPANSEDTACDYP